MDKIKLIKHKREKQSLFLQGVFISDCKKIEDIFQDRLISNDIPQEKMLEYDKIPALFTGIDDWLKYTNILCNFCSRSFKTFPWFEPQSIDPISMGVVGKITTSKEIKSSVNKKKYSIVPKGIFCSCHCVAANILTKTKNIAEKHNKMDMLKFLYEIVHGEKIDDIQPSPDPTIMTQYGGNVTPNEYQQMIDNLSNLFLKRNDFNSMCNNYLQKIIE